MLLSTSQTSRELNVSAEAISPKARFTQLTANSAELTKIKVKNFVIPDGSHDREKVLTQEKESSYKVN
jgi:hypothetical protein